MKEEEDDDDYYAHGGRKLFCNVSEGRRDGLETRTGRWFSFPDDGRMILCCFLLFLLMVVMDGLILGNVLLSVISKSN